MLSPSSLSSGRSKMKVSPRKKRFFPPSPRTVLSRIPDGEVEAHGAEPPSERGAVAVEAPSPSPSPEEPDEPEQRPLLNISEVVENIMDRGDKTKDHDVVPRKNDREDGAPAPLGPQEGDHHHDASDGERADDAGERFSDAPTEEPFPARILYGMFIMRSNTASPVLSISSVSAPAHGGGAHFAQFLNDFRPQSPLDQHPPSKSAPAEFPAGGRAEGSGKNPPNKPKKKVLEVQQPQPQHPWAAWSFRDDGGSAGSNTPPPLPAALAPLPIPQRRGGQVVYCLFSCAKPGAGPARKEESASTEQASPSTTVVRAIVVEKKPAHLRPSAAANRPVHRLEQEDVGGEKLVGAKRGAQPQMLSSGQNGGGGKTGEAQTGRNGKTLGNPARAGPKEVGISSNKQRRFRHLSSTTSR